MKQRRNTPSKHKGTKAHVLEHADSRIEKIIRKYTKAENLFKQAGQKIIDASSTRSIKLAQQALAASQQGGIFMDVAQELYKEASAAAIAEASLAQAGHALKGIHDVIDKFEVAANTAKNTAKAATRTAITTEIKLASLQGR